jgi:phosphoribosylformylglycinamidine synthase PurS subunit
MANYKVWVGISLKSGVNDPEGESIKRAVRTLGFQDVETFRSGRLVVIQLTADDANDAKVQVVQMIDTSWTSRVTHPLVNKVLESYRLKARKQRG